ncbi:MAG: hypothetical protein Q9226_000886 [Calogaya cf. arnoldii]
MPEECGGQHGNRPLSFQKSAEQNRADTKDRMSILRTSKSLYEEVSAELYRNRDLHLRINVLFDRNDFAVGDPPKKSIAFVPWSRFKQIVFFISVDTEVVRSSGPEPQPMGLSHYDMTECMHLGPNGNLLDHMKSIASKINGADSVSPLNELLPKFDMAFHISLAYSVAEFGMRWFHLVDSIFTPFQDHAELRKAIIRLPWGHKTITGLLRLRDDNSDGQEQEQLRDWEGRIKGKFPEGTDVSITYLPWAVAKKVSDMRSL